jgi:hypothetical protein
MIHAEEAKRSRELPTPGSRVNRSVGVPPMSLAPRLHHLPNQHHHRLMAGTATLRRALPPDHSLAFRTAV